MKAYDRFSLPGLLAGGGVRRTPDMEWQQNSAKSVLAAREPSIFILQMIAPFFFRKSTSKKGKDFSFNSEAEFWRASTRLTLASVNLNRFRICDWFPRAPGVYWSNYGEMARESAFSRFHPSGDEVLGDYFSPESKLQLIEQGGVGTVRLRPKVIDGQSCQLAVAMVGSQCAGGVPLAIPSNILRSSDFDWGDTVNIEGEVRFLADVGLEDAAASVHHAAPIIVFVNKITTVAQRQKRTEPIIITPVVLFSQEKNKEILRWRNRGNFAYSFIHCDFSSSLDLNYAAEWMTRYADKHNGKVITNFDEICPILADAPLSYQRLVIGEYDTTYIETMHLHGSITGVLEEVGQMNVNNSVTLGDGAVIHGDLIVAGSINDSFNRSDSIGAADVRELLKNLSSQVGGIISQMDHDQAKRIADDLETLTKELAREQPREEWWKLSLSGIKDAALAVGVLGKPIVETVGLLLPLLSGAG